MDRTSGQRGASQRELQAEEESRPRREKADPMSSVADISHGAASPRLSPQSFGESRLELLRLFALGSGGGRGGAACRGGSLGPADGSDLSGASASAEELIASVGLESRHAHLVRHV